jgi:hypothetical protein
MSQRTFGLQPPAVVVPALKLYFWHRHTPTSHVADAFRTATAVSTAVVPWQPVTVTVTVTEDGRVVPLGHEHAPLQQQPACIMLTV